MWATSLRTCRNFQTQVHGGAINRAGTQFLQELNSNSAAKLVPFVFSITQAYVLEFSPGRVRAYANGAPVVSSSTVSISGVTLSGTGPYTRIVATSSPHGLVAGDGVQIADVTATGAYDVNGSWIVLTAPTATTFTVRASGVNTGVYASGGTVAAFAQVTTPYVEADLPDLRWAQSADVLTVVHPNYPPYEFARTSSTTFTFTEFTPERGPFQEINDSESVKMYASARRGAVTLTATADVFETGAHENALVYLEEQFLQSVSPWEPVKQAVAPGGNPFGELRRSDGKVYKCVSDHTSGSTYGTFTGTVRPTHTVGVETDGDGKGVPNIADISGVAWEYLHSGFGVLRIDSVSSATQAAATVLVTLPDTVVGGPTTAQGPWSMTGDDADVTLTTTGATSNNIYDYELTFDGVIQNPQLYSVNAATPVMTFYDAPAAGVAVSARQLANKHYSDVWAFGAWTPDQKYPRTVTYFDDRLIFFSTSGQPQTFWASKTGEYTNFGKSVPQEDSDPIIVTLNARQINAIRDALPMDDLVVMTEAAAWRVVKGTDTSIKSGNVGFRVQNYRGASSIPGKLIGDSAVFVQNNATKIRDLRYQLDVDKFAGDELSLRAEHLLDRSKYVVAMDYAEEPYSILWIVRSDGVLLSLCYVREQEVVGWAHHDTENGYFEDVAVIPEDGENIPYFVVRRTVNGNTERYLERLHTRSFTDQRDAFFVDAGLSYDGRNVSSTAVTLSSAADWTVDDTLTLAASAPLFASTDVGDVIIIDNEIRFAVETYVSDTVVQGRPDRTVVTAYRDTATTTWSFARDTFTGLDHLEGETVKVLGDGLVLTSQTVVGGSITVPTHSAVVHVGLGITADLETLDVNVQGAESVRATHKRIPSVSAIVEDTSGLMVGPDSDNLVELKQRDDEDYDVPTELLTGLAGSIPIPTRWDTESRLFIRQTEPLPISILGLIPDVEFTDQE